MIVLFCLYWDKCIIHSLKHPHNSLVLVIEKLPSVENRKDISQTRKLLSQPKKHTTPLDRESKPKKIFLKPKNYYLKLKNYPK